MRYFFPTLLLAFALWCPLTQASDTNRVRCAWYHWDPYQYIDASGQLCGLDHALVSAIFKDAGIEVVYDTRGDALWADNQQDVFTGAMDITAGAFATPGRIENYHLSQPYRHESNALYIRADDRNLGVLDNLDELLSYTDRHKIRVGIVSGYNYTSEEINDFIRQQKMSGTHLLAEAKTEEENFSNLVKGNVGLVISDRLAAAQIIWRNKWGGRIEEHCIALPAKPIHLLIHKDTNAERDRLYRTYLDKFNTSLERLGNAGEVDRIIGHYLFPVLMNITVQRPWFHVTNVVGMVFFALAGLLLAFDNRYDLFGVCVMTLLLSSGGGIIRDLLAGRPLAFLDSPLPVSIATVVAISGVALFKVHHRLRIRNTVYDRWALLNAGKWETLRVLIDNIGLGAYTIIGVGVTVEMQLAPLLLWGPVFGCLTACGGGLLAGFLNDRKVPGIMRGSFDPLVSLLGGLFFSGFLLWQTHRLHPGEVFAGVLLTMAGITISLTVIRFKNWRLPTY